jgi:hypothetical protein
LQDTTKTTIGNVSHKNGDETKKHQQNGDLSANKHNDGSIQETDADKPTKNEDKT